MILEVHILARNEEEILPHTLRFYRKTCAKIVVHDLGSSDKTKDIAKSFGATVFDVDSGGVFNDLINKSVKNNCWRGTDADWVICADADELIYFPAGAEETLASYDQQNIAVVNPYGYEMTSEVFPTGEGPITDYVKHGGRDDFWYGKKILFSPKRVASVDFGTGAHITNAVLKDGRRILVDSKSPVSSPSTFLLHFHHLGPVEKIGAKYEAVIARLSPENRAHKWGVQADGHRHARDKRAMIVSRIERIIP